jgi:RNA polymerase sigma-70 factor (ECF subfamily)
MLAEEASLTPDALPTRVMSEPKSHEAGELWAWTAALRRGDDSAWRKFHEVYWPRLFRYHLVLAHGNESVAQEATQQTFLRAVRHIREFDSEAVLWSWLTALARSVAVDEIRRQTRQRSLLDRFFHRQTSEKDAPPVDADEQLLTLLEVQLTALPEAERTLLERKYLAGESVRELAASLATTEKAVDSRLVRARQQLRQTLLAALHHD